MMPLIQLTSGYRKRRLGIQTVSRMLCSLADLMTFAGEGHLSLHWDGDKEKTCTEIFF